MTELQRQSGLGLKTDQHCLVVSVECFLGQDAQNSRKSRRSCENIKITRLMKDGVHCGAVLYSAP